ncbi:hypothetical protein NESM_000848700 [Novymonas esmeraldas]|uniref:Protein kinase domain-containing protein n=1 Tax=Novymonas esmeraldas TaxID=1808958 RepID=A0AAW0F0H4_9TRYP
MCSAEQLGAGSFGAVTAAHRYDGSGAPQPVALKRISLRGETRFSAWLRTIQLVGREVDLCSRAARSPWVVPMYHPWFDCATGAVVLPQAAGDVGLQRCTAGGVRCHRTALDVGAGERVRGDGAALGGGIVGEYTCTTHGSAAHAASSPRTCRSVATAWRGAVWLDTTGGVQLSAAASDSRGQSCCACAAVERWAVLVCPPWRLVCAASQGDLRPASSMAHLHSLARFSLCGEAHFGATGCNAPLPSSRCAVVTAPKLLAPSCPAMRLLTLLHAATRCRAVAGALGGVAHRLGDARQPHTSARHTRASSPACTAAALSTDNALLQVFTNTQIHRCTDAQIHRYTDGDLQTC